LSDRPIVFTGAGSYNRDGAVERRQGNEPVMPSFAHPQKRTERPRPTPAPLRFKPNRQHHADVCEIPPATRQVLRSPGRPLDGGAIALMEPLFGHDFSRVRVHSDTKAAQSADAVGARAYAVGRHLVFGPGEYAPATAQGRSLIAHELAHVVQDPNPDLARPALRRSPKEAKTSAGTFVADPYDEFLVLGAASAIVGYGANITIRFKANDRVDARQIAFVQTALSVMDDRIVNKYEGRYGTGGEVAARRLIPEGQPGEGVHVDQIPNIRTPLAGMTRSTGDDLASSQPDKKLAEIGWHYRDAHGELVNRDAMTHDEPYLNSGDVYTEASKVMKQVWGQQFETTALAIDGNQNGTFYGSVQWGWTKSVADPYPRLLEFKAKSADLPSPVFMEAAKLWNASATTDNKETIDLPIDLHVTSESAQLWESPDQRKKVATLTRNTTLGRIAKVDRKGRIWWASVIVTGGPSTGKTGWIKEADLH
jgi:hypothetical protein